MAKSGARISVLGVRVRDLIVTVSVELNWSSAELVLVLCSTDVETSNPTEAQCRQSSFGIHALHQTRIAAVLRDRHLLTISFRDIGTAKPYQKWLISHAVCKQT